MKRLALVLTFLILVSGSLYALGRQSAPVDDGRLKVTTSIYPIYFFTKEIGGDKISVSNLTPAGAEPHDYELTPQDHLVIRSSKLLIINGGLEPWAEKIKQGLQSTVLVEVSGGRSDPHVWIDPKLAMNITNKIFQVLSETDPRNVAFYQANLNSLNTRLAKLDGEFKKGLMSCQSKDVVTSHSAFGYLTDAYGLEQISISGISPDSEPSIKRLSEIADMVKEKGIKTIFFESLISPKLAETIAKETGAGTDVLDPIEGLTSERVANGEDYFSVMRQNLVNLREALICQ